MTGQALALAGDRAGTDGGGHARELAGFRAANPDVMIACDSDGGFPSGQTWTATRTTADGTAEVVARARYADELLTMLARNLPLVRARDELASVWGHWYVLWAGSGLLRARRDGSEVTFTGTSAAGLGAAIGADAAAVRAGEVAWLRMVHGDIADDIRVEAGAFRGRWRFGAGQEAATRTAAGLDAIFRAGEGSAAGVVIPLYVDERMSAAKVAAATGISVARVRGILERAGVVRSHSHKAVSEELAAEIVEACTSGLTWAQIAAQVGRPVRTIGYVLRRHLPPPGGKDLVRPREAAQITGVTAQYLAMLAARGVIGCVRLSPRGQHWYDREEMTAFAGLRKARASARDVPPAAGDG